LVVDDAFAAVGTANMDSRSFRLNYEVIAVRYDAAGADALAEHFARDLRHAHQVDLGALANDRLFHRLAHAGARLLSPLLRSPPPRRCEGLALLRPALLPQDAGLLPWKGVLLPPPARGTLHPAEPPGQGLGRALGSPVQDGPRPVQDGPRPVQDGPRPVQDGP